MTGASFDSTKTPLQDLLTRADTGSLQLPAIQRGCVWDDERIRSLLASVSVESDFQPGRLLTLRTRNSADYKGLHALLMREGGRDFRTGEPIEAQTFFDDKIDIHHIVPEKWCKTANIEPATYNGVINKAASSARTNQIGGCAPSGLPAVERAAGIDAARMEEILASHCIAAESLRADRFRDFDAARAEALLACIEAATGKTIAREPELLGAGVVPERYDEGPEEWDAEEPLEEVAP